MYIYVHIVHHRAIAIAYNVRLIFQIISLEKNRKSETSNGTNYSRVEKQSIRNQYLLATIDFWFIWLCDFLKQRE